MLIKQISLVRPPLKPTFCPENADRSRLLHISQVGYFSFGMGESEGYWRAKKYSFWSGDANTYTLNSLHLLVKRDRPFSFTSRRGSARSGLLGFTDNKQPSSMSFWVVIIMAAWLVGFIPMYNTYMALQTMPHMFPKLGVALKILPAKSVPKKHTFKAQEACTMLARCQSVNVPWTNEARRLSSLSMVLDAENALGDTVLGKTFGATCKHAASAWLRASLVRAPIAGLYPESRPLTALLELSPWLLMCRF